MRRMALVMMLLVMAFGFSSMASAAVIILDDDDAVASPSSATFDNINEWELFSSAQAYDPPDVDQGNDFLYKAMGDGDATVTWSTPISEAGDYIVSAWWDDAGWGSEPLAKRSKNVPHTIEVSTDSGVTWSELASLTVDQTTQGPGGGKWNQLGLSYTFAAGDWARVVLSDDATEAPVSGATTWVVADAVQFSTSEVPIPGAVWLLGSGLIGLVAFRGRGRKRG